MNSNPAPMNIGLITWWGATGAIRPVDFHNYTKFGFVFEVTTDIATDAVFNIMYHDGTALDPCVADAAQPVPEVAICSSEATPGPQATVTIPAGTTAGTIATGTIPCRLGRFVSLAAVSGDTANVDAVVVLQGPKS